MLTPPIDTDTDVVIAGAGVGGLAAALALLSRGRSVILLEETTWIGGQLTAQGVPPDEHGWIEVCGATRTYRKFRQEVRNYYFRNYPVRRDLLNQVNFNPGNGWVSPLCHEPLVALAVLRDMLAPYLASGRAHLYLRHKVVAVEKSGEAQIDTLISRDQSDNREYRHRGRYFLDTTENGDLLPLAEMEYVTGSESREMTGEPGAPSQARPDNVQAFSFCFILEHINGANFIGDPPAQYSYWRNYRPELTPPWPGKWLNWEALNPRTMEKVCSHFHPHQEEPRPFSGLWSFRRILDRSQFEQGFFPSDLCLVNWPMTDYLEGHLLADDPEEVKGHLHNARQLSLSLFHWLQTDAPRPDGGQGWPGLRLRPDLLGTGDGLAMAPYIRESRRIRALQTITEQEVSARCRPGDPLAERYGNSVGIGYYRIDLHPTTGGDNYVDVPSLPFRIPLGALIPVTMENLLPAAKNIGTTHITNGCYRLHPVEWNIGESVGHLVHYCLENHCLPRDVHDASDHLSRYQDQLRQQGIELEWPGNLNLDDGDPHAHAR